MKNFLQITASFDKPELLENMVKQLAVKHNDIGYGNAHVPGLWKALETSTIESYVSGTIEINMGIENPIRMPFTSCFLFTCTKERLKEYKLNWSISLS